MKEINRAKMIKSPCFVDRGAYDEQKCYDVGVKIISSKEKSYDEILNSLKPFGVNDRIVLKNVLERLREYNFTFGRASTIIIKHKYNLKYNIVDEEISKEFAKIGNLKKEKYVVENKKPSTINVYRLNRNKVSLEERVKMAKEFSEMLMSGTTKDEISQKYNISSSTINHYLCAYLPKSPKEYVEYKIFKHKVDIISSKEVEQYIEVLIYFIKNLLETQKRLMESKATSNNKREVNMQISRIVKQREMYQKALSVLESKNQVKSSELILDDDYIKDFCMNYSNSLKTYNLLKSNNVSDNTQKKINEEYKKLVYVK